MPDHYPYRFDLEKAIATWRHMHARRRAFTSEDLDELERHLRDHTADLTAAGMDEATAYRKAVAALGDMDSGEAEYRKVRWGKLRRQRQLTEELNWRAAMLKNYLTVALRSMWRRPGYTAINLTGLAVGLACSFFILLWVEDELRYDRFLPDGDRIHRVWRNVHMGNHTYTWSGTPKPLGDLLRTDYPDITHAVQILSQEFIVTRGQEPFREQGMYATDAFFEVFAFPFVQGDPETALDSENAVVITERIARKLFGDDPVTQTAVVGQSLTVDQRDYTITGVIEDLPQRSSLQFDVVLPAQVFFARNTWVDQWGANFLQLYVTLRDDAAPPSVNTKIADIINQNEANADEALFLQPYGDLYLHSDYENGQLVGGRIEYVRIFSGVAVFLLLIAAINFMNLATARSARRAREIGVRKTVGAARRTLVGQFLSESVLLALLSFLLALVLVLGLLPFFNGLTGKSIAYADLGVRFVLGGFAIALLVGLLAGSYPALYLSSFNPLAVLRGRFLPQQAGADVLRKGLIIFQFGLSTVLIVVTVAAYLQIQYIHERDLGLQRDNLIYLPQEGGLHSQYEAVRQELLEEPSIASVTASSSSPLNIRSSTGSARWPGMDPDYERETYIVSARHDFLETMQMELVAGRTFSRAFGADTTNLVVNEEMARAMGGEVVGRELSFWGQTGTIIGVVNDFDMNSLYAPIEPVVIRLAPENTSQLFVRTQPGRTSEALASLEAVAAAFNPDYPFTYRFLDEAFEATYRSEVIMGRLANVFAGIAIFVSCLGLLGLVSYMAEQRTKEISVRKVLGATVPRLVFLLTGEVTKLVGIGILLAIPLSYYAAASWLNSFESHIELGAGVFVIVGLAAVAVAWVTVSVQAVRAAFVDPAQSLRGG